MRPPAASDAGLAGISPRDAGAPTPAAAQVWLVETATGSLYRVCRDAAGAWWLSANNVANACSRSLSDGDWEIAPPEPWPPVVGQRLLLEAVPGLRRDDPRRVPGGGKWTSPVVEVRVSSQCDAAAPHAEADA